MTLSALELRTIKDLEERITADDSRLAVIFHQNVKQHRAARKPTRALFAVAPGPSLMILASSIPSVPLGVGGFLAMCAGAYIFAFPPVMPGLRPDKRKDRKPFHSTSQQ